MPAPSTSNPLAAISGVEERSLPGVVEPLTDLSKVWVLYYRHGFNANCQKAFVLDGDVRCAVERTKKHCEIMGYRWIFVRPLVVDLTQEEIDHVRRV